MLLPGSSDSCSLPRLARTLQDNRPVPGVTLSHCRRPEQSRQLTNICRIIFCLLPIKWESPADWGPALFANPTRRGKSPRCDPHLAGPEGSSMMVTSPGKGQITGSEGKFLNSMAVIHPRLWASSGLGPSIPPFLSEQHVGPQLVRDRRGPSPPAGDPGGWPPSTQRG